MIEVLSRFNLFQSMTPFRRCLHCNGRLEPVAKEAIVDRLLPKTRQYYDEFSHCPACGRIYWKGSHHERMQHLIDRVSKHHLRPVSRGHDRA